MWLNCCAVWFCCQQPHLALQGNWNHRMTKRSISDGHMTDFHKLTYTVLCWGSLKRIVVRLNENTFYKKTNFLGGVALDMPSRCFNYICINIYATEWSAIRHWDIPYRLIGGVYFLQTILLSRKIWLTIDNGLWDRYVQARGQVHLRINIKSGAATQ